MSNNIKVKATFNEQDGNWYLDILPPMFFSGNTVTQEGITYIQGTFKTKEEAYNVAKQHLILVGFDKNIIDNGIDYE